MAMNAVRRMAGILEDIHPALRSLWDLENELRSAAQNAIFLRNDEAKKHMDEARRHYREALKSIRGGAGQEPPPVGPPDLANISKDDDKKD